MSLPAYAPHMHTPAAYARYTEWAQGYAARGIWWLAYEVAGQMRPGAPEAEALYSDWATRAAAAGDLDSALTHAAHLHDDSRHDDLLATLFRQAARAGDSERLARIAAAVRDEGRRAKALAHVAASGGQTGEGERG